MSEGGDLASAETVLPLAPNSVAAFFADVDRLLRLNPLLAIERWAPEGPGRFRLVARNESNEQLIDTPVDIEEDERGLTLRYASGLKQATRLRVEPAPEGTRLFVTEHYPRIEDAQDPRVVEVDRSLVPWVAALRRHLLSRARWGRLPLIFPVWSWWSEGIMLSMAPRNRRIVRLIVWLSAIEFAVFIGMVVVLRLAA
ncbi:MAG: hypothetical protein HZC22_05250 [Rhodocyclales bacterium]|nr:hypothetical protein [Rhodocyclales bacterium]